MAESMMRAVELRGDGLVHGVERPIPPPGEGDLLLEVRQVGLCATDREIRDGTMSYFRSGMGRYPVIPGHEWVADVIAVGPGVGELGVGDRVVGECSIGCGACGTCAEGRYHMCADRRETGLIGLDGGLATHMVFPARAARRVPADVPDDDACLIEPTAIAVNAVSVSGLTPGGDVLVVGAGPIGLLAAQVAKAKGAGGVTVGDISESRLKAALAMGADRVVDARGPGGDETWPTVVEASGHPSGLEFAIRHTRAGGTIACVSLYGLPSVPVDADTLVTRDLTLRGALGSPHRWEESVELVSRRAVTPGRLITTRLPLSRAAEGFDLIGHPEQIKISVIMNSEETP